MRATHSKVKKLAMAAVAIAAALFLGAGLWLRSPELAVIGALIGAAMMGLLVLMTFRRAGHLIVLARKSEAEIRQELFYIGRAQMRLAEDMHRAALADFRELMLGAYRELGDAVGEVSGSLANASEKLARAATTQARIEQAIVRVGAMSDAIDIQLGALSRRFQEASATVERIEKHTDSQATEARRQGEIVSGTLASIQERIGLQLAEAQRLDDVTSAALAKIEERISLQSTEAERLGGITSAALAKIEERVGLQSKELGRLGGATAGIFATVEQKIVQKSETMERLMKGVAESLDEKVVKPLRKIGSAIDNGDLRYPLLNDIGSILRLQQRFTPGAALPRMSGWAMDGSTLERLIESILERRPSIIVECGSGASTVWLAYAAREIGARVISFEHLDRFAQQTREELARHGLQDIADVRLAPLHSIEVEGGSYRWYGQEAYHDLVGIDMLLVDGPPKATGEHARFPAVPLLKSRLADHCVVVFDDVHRKQEQEILDLWRKSNPGMGEDHALGERTVLVEWDLTKEAGKA